MVTGLTHLGTFKIPDGTFGGPAYMGFHYGGTALSHNIARNSLFMVGHNQAQLVAEVSIPGFDETAMVLQNFHDPTEGLRNTVNPGDPNFKVIGGTLALGTGLISSVYSNYDGLGTQRVSHFLRSIDFSVPGMQGPIQVGPMGAGFYSGYMGKIPKPWRSRLGGPCLTGNACIAVIARSSLGPCAHAFNAADLSPAGAQPLVYYTEQHATLGGWHGASQWYGGSDTMRGVCIWDDSMLFFGRHGDTFSYGSGTDDPDLHGTLVGPSEPGVMWCYDPGNHSKGVHGYPYRATCWAYALSDLADVHAGLKKPWEILPYAAWTLPIGHEVGGAAIDPATGRIYVSAMLENGTLPVVHVFTAA